MIRWLHAHRGRRTLGYTLIEMLTVSAILAILAAMAIAAVTKARIQARQARAVMEVKSFANTYMTYFAKHGEYPHWGPGQKYSSPGELWNDLIATGYLPRQWSGYQPNAANGRVYGVVQGYFVEIPAFEADPGGVRSPENYFKVVFVPYGFQEGYIALAVDPVTGHETPVPLYSKDNNLANYSLYPIPDS